MGYTMHVRIPTATGIGHRQQQSRLALRTFLPRQTKTFEPAERPQAACSLKCTSRPIAVAMLTSASSEKRDTRLRRRSLMRSWVTPHRCAASVWVHLLSLTMAVICRIRSERARRLLARGALGGLHLSLLVQRDPSGSGQFNVPRARRLGLLLERVQHSGSMSAFSQRGTLDAMLDPPPMVMYWNLSPGSSWWRHRGRSRRSVPRAALGREPSITTGSSAERDLKVRRPKAGTSLWLQQEKPAGVGVLDNKKECCHILQQ